MEKRSPNKVVEELKKELNELNEKIIKLYSCLITYGTKKLIGDNQFSFLQMQHGYMTDYASTLVRRIDDLIEKESRK